MVLILSQNTDTSTNFVIDWLLYYNAAFERINDNDIPQKKETGIKISNECGIDVTFQKDADNIITNNNISSIWYRRSNTFTVPSLQNENIEEDLKNKLYDNMFVELRYARNAFYSALKEKKWLNHPSNSNEVDKFEMLIKAQKAGLSIPSSLITNNKRELEQFKEEYGNIITKAIYNIDFFPYKDKKYLAYTTIVTNKQIEDLPSKFFPCIVQECLEKEFELRIFYLAEKLYSMAIFSQKDSQTEIDFRVYNNKNPNRTVPFKLPKNIEQKILFFMNSINMNCGSIDMIKTTKGEWVFLEINPVGQFGMTSGPNNYFLEEKIAQYLYE
jgi:ATP-GRASP peptide maturase of grasp-with-spasm system